MLTRRTFAFFLIVSLLVLVFRTLFYFEQKQTSGFIETEGQVLNEPYLSRNKINFRVGRYRIVSDYQNINYGDFVAVKGNLEEGTIEAEKVNEIEKKGLEKWVTKVRLNLNEQIKKNLPAPQSQLLSGVVLGVKSNLSKDFRDDLVNTGTLHVVVVSGYNIALVAGLALSLSFLIGRRKASLLAAFLVIGYTLLVGLSAPTLRAAIMAILTIFATLLGRRTLAIYLLFITAYILVLISPENLLDISFQLTFLATLGLITLTKPVSTLLKKVINPVREPLSTTLAAQILVAPLIFFYFGNVSLISPFVNVLVLWTIPISTVGGFVYLLALQINSFLGNLIGYLLLIPLTIFVKVVGFFGSFNFLVIKTESGNWVSVLGYSLVVFALLLFFLKRRYVRKPV